jgi:hypothetical protein
MQLKAEQGREDSKNSPHKSATSHSAVSGNICDHIGLEAMMPALGVAIDDSRTANEDDGLKVDACFGTAQGGMGASQAPLHGVHYGL